MSFGLVMSLKALAEREVKRGDKEAAAILNAAIIRIDQADARDARIGLPPSSYAPNSRER